jgi:FtsP/CotA-like multicopper oxidase with cupredoxin domain
MPQHGRSEVSLAQASPSAPIGITQVVRLDAVRHAWEVAPGRVVHGYGYDDQVPGPTVEATVGDTLLVRFTNSLPEPTSMCWHGLSLPRAMAGVAAAAVQPGRSVEYRMRLVDAGTFWYHAHPRHSPQTERGLYGVVVVSDPADPCPVSEQVLIFADSPERSERRMPLVNGVEEAQMLLAPGHRERWRLVNATSAIRLRLSLVEHAATAAHIAQDPSFAPVDVDELALAPGNGRDLIVGPFAPHQRLNLQARAESRDGTTTRRRLVTLHIAGLGQRSISV